VPQRRNNPGSQFVKKSPAADDQPWNKSQIVVEPAEPAAPNGSGRYSDRIMVPPMDEQGRATDRALKGWPEGIKKA
jgi:hypothetical protein